MVNNKAGKKLDLAQNQVRENWFCAHRPHRKEEQSETEIPSLQQL